MSETTTVRMWGNTRAVRIPKSLARQTGLETGTAVRLTPSKDGLLLAPIRKKTRIKLSDLLAQCKGRNPHRELITGKAGKEVF